MKNITQILDKATSRLAECLKDPKRITPYNKERIDNAQELLLDLLCELKE